MPKIKTPKKKKNRKIKKPNIIQTLFLKAIQKFKLPTSTSDEDVFIRKCVKLANVRIHIPKKFKRHFLFSCKSNESFSECHQSSVLVPKR